MPLWNIAVSVDTLFSEGISYMGHYGALRRKSTHVDLLNIQHDIIN